MYRKMPCPGPSISLQRQTMMWHLYFFAPPQHALMPPLFPSHTSSKPLVFMYMAPLASIKNAQNAVGLFCPFTMRCLYYKKNTEKKTPSSLQVVLLSRHHHLQLVQQPLVQEEHTPALDKGPYATRADATEPPGQTFSAVNNLQTGDDGGCFQGDGTRLRAVRAG